MSDSTDEPFGESVAAFLAREREDWHQAAVELGERVTRLQDDLHDALGINEQVIAEHDAMRTAIELAGWCPIRQGDGSYKLEVFDGA